MDRLLGFLDGDAPGTQAAKIGAFRVIFALVMGTEYWARAIPKWGDLSPFYVASLAVASGLCVVGLSARWARVAFGGLALLHAAVVWREFPATGNHAYLEVIFCLLCALLNPGVAEDQRLFLRSIRWIVCLVFFYGGLQKLMHGYYFHGQYFAYALSTESFRSVLQFLLPADEVLRLAAYKGQVGDGPYLVADPIFLVLCQAVYIVEMALAPLLLVRSTRRWAVLAAITFVIAIEIAAREVFFGLVFMNAILLFLRSDFNRQLIPVCAAILLGLILVRLRILPEVVFY